MLRRLSVLGWTLGLSSLTSSTARAGDDPSRVVQLVAAHSDDCLGVAEQSVAEGAPVVQVGCDRKRPGRTWRVEGGGGDLFRFVAIHSGQCLTVPQEGPQIVQSPCRKPGANQAQLFKIDGLWDQASITSAKSGRCVDVSGRSKDHGAAIIHHQCTRATNQRFVIRALGGPATPAPIDPIVGDWHWFNDVRVSILSDGTMRGTNDERGRWRFDREARTYLLEWQAGWIDRLTMSHDTNSLSGSNDHGTRVSGYREGSRPRPTPEVEPVVTKTRDCGTGPDDPGCETEKDGKLPVDAEMFQGLLSAAKAQRSQISRRDQVLAALDAQRLTARQYGLLLDLFNSEIDRMRVAKGLAKNVVDPNRALGFASKWRSSINQRDYTKLISETL